MPRAGRAPELLTLALTRSPAPFPLWLQDGYAVAFGGRYRQQLTAANLGYQVFRQRGVGHRQRSANSSCWPPVRHSIT